MAIKRILNTTTGKYYKLRQKTTANGTAGQIMGLWSPKRTSKRENLLIGSKIITIKMKKYSETSDVLLAIENNRIIHEEGYYRDEFLNNPQCNEFKKFAVKIEQASEKMMKWLEAHRPTLRDTPFFAI